MLPGSEHWRPVVVAPGRASAASDLGALVGDGRFVLAVDQFEELFTACETRPSATRFIHELVRARRPRARRRSCSRCGPTSTAAAPAYPELSRAARRQPRARPADARATSCARRSSARRERAGLDVEPELTDRLMADVERQPGACRCSPPRCSSSGSGATAAGCASPPTRRPAGSAAPSPAWPSARSPGSTPAQQPLAREVLMRLVERRARTGSSAAGSGSPSSSGTPSSSRRRTSSPTRAC